MSNKDERWTVAALLRASKEYLEARGADSARLDAELLLGNILDCSRLDLFMRHEMPVTDADRSGFRELIKRRAQGEPTAYILGRREFHGLDFKVDQRCLIPRPETEHVVDAVLELIAGREKPAVLDLGTGSGCITVALAHRHSSGRYVAVDVDEGALALATQNAKRLVPDASIEFLCGDLFAPLESRGPFDVIVSNPPYIELHERETLAVDVRDYEPGRALFSESGALAFHERILDEGVGAVVPGGALVLELPDACAGRMREAVAARSGWEPDCKMIRDLAGIERVAVVRRRA